MAEKTCTVTAIDSRGKRYTLTVTASSMYRAAMAFDQEVLFGANHRHYPRPALSTRFEIILPDGRVLQTNWDSVMKWANRNRSVHM